jgi:S1-C subfamily serine protease
LSGDRPHRSCARCGTALGDSARFCGHCGAHAAEAVATAGGPAAEAEGGRPWPRAFVAAGLVAAALLAAGWIGYHRIGSEQDEQQDATAALTGQMKRLERSVARLAKATTALSGRVDELEAATRAGLAPVAARTLKSVYSIETADGSGSGWAAWTEQGATFVITANHVVEGAKKVTVHQKASSWRGTVTKTDAVNDLALVRVGKEIGPPLWPDADVQPTPSVGDTLVLVGSPYGLEGTVTTGVVSRITYNEIQTDAAANPGNSGGPAVDRDGRVVGVLLSGGGENLNFTVPIKRACITIRDC